MTHKSQFTLVAKSSIFKYIESIAFSSDKSNVILQ
jgi:hypothetical protein